MGNVDKIALNAGDKSQGDHVETETISCDGVQNGLETC